MHAMKQAIKMQLALSAPPTEGFLPQAAFAGLPSVPSSAVQPHPARYRRLSRSRAWHLAAELALLASSGGYAVYALLHMGL